MNKLALTLAAAGLALAGLAGTAHAQTSASPYTSATRYDLLGRVTGTIAPNSVPTGITTFQATRTTYDAAGRPTKIESGYLTAWQAETVAPSSWPVWNGSSGFNVLTTQETTYNAQNQKLIERVKGSDLVPYALTQYSYDSSGRLDCTAVRMNSAAYSSLPASACTLGTQGGDGPDRITRNIYDVAGQLVQVREGVGAGSTIEAAEVTYTYTLNGKIEHVIDAGGHKARKCYDSFDRQVRWVFPSTTNPGAFNDSTPALAVSSAGAVNGDCTASTGDYELYEYDLNGNRTKLRKRDGSELTYQYDKLNRMTYKTVPYRADLPLENRRSVEYAYDLRGNMLSAGFDGTAGQQVIYFAYDGFGRKISETQVMDGATRVLGSAYDANGRRVQLTHPDNIYVYYHGHQTGQLFYATLSNYIPLFRPIYDDFGRAWQVVTLNTATADWGSGAARSFDPISRMSSYWYSFKDPTTFTHNPAGQISSRTESNNNYVWNGAAAMDHDYIADGLNRYSNIEGVTHTYDANGNLTSDGTHTYTYDIENRLIGRAAGTTAALRYDPLGRLYQVVGSDTGTTRFLHDGDALVAEYNGSGTMLRRYVHGPAEGVDDPMVWFEGPGTTDAECRYLYADERGSIVAVTGSTGSVLTINKYDEYGQTNTTIGNDIPVHGRFRYTGQAYIPELGMYYYKARIYSPTLGRFMQTDPIGYDDQFNLYGYVGNDPINGVDPFGMATVHAQKSNSLPGIRVSVKVDADVNDDGTDDLSQGQLDSIGSKFSAFVNRNNGKDVSGSGKPVTGTANMDEKATVGVVSQFVGHAIGRQVGWSNFSRIIANKGWFGMGDYSSCGGNTSAYACASLDQNYVSFTGKRLGGILGIGLYSDPTNIGRILTHEGLHHQRGESSITPEGERETFRDANRIFDSSILGR